MAGFFFFSLTDKYVGVLSFKYWSAAIAVTQVCCDTLFCPLDPSLRGGPLAPSHMLLSLVSRLLAFGKPLTFLRVSSCHLIIVFRNEKSRESVQSLVQILWTTKFNSVIQSSVWLQLGPSGLLIGSSWEYFKKMITRISATEGFFCLWWFCSLIIYHISS